MNNALSGEDLKVVFDLCQPNQDGLISLTTLQSLLDQHTNLVNDQGHPPSKDILTDFQDASKAHPGDDWITYEEFCHGVRNLLDCPSEQVFETCTKTCSEPQTPSSADHSSSRCSSLDCSLLNSSQDIPNPFLGNVSCDDSGHMSLQVDVSHHDADLSVMEDISPYSLTDSALGGSAMSPEPLDEAAGSISPAGQDKSQCSSLSDDREENFISYGENNDADFETCNNCAITIDLVDYDEVDRAGQNHKSSSSCPSSSDYMKRNAWMRTSLRRAPAAACNDQLVPPRRWGSLRHSKRVSSNALASALYHGHGANSSGRSSNCDDGDMHSDISLEEDVLDLNHKVQILQNQVGQLAESQASTDDRYSKVRQENVTLNQRIHVLEEQLREMDQRSSEKLGEEQKRNRELLARLEREKQLEIENYSIRLQSLEREYNSTVRDVSHLRSQNEKLKSEKNHLEQELFETQQNLLSVQKEFDLRQDSFRREQDQAERQKQLQEHLVDELSKELESMKSAKVMLNGTERGGAASESDHANAVSHMAHLSDMETELKALRERNRKLQESNDELEAVLMNRSLEAGKAILSQTHLQGPSIEMELRNMDDSQDYAISTPTQEEVCQLRAALKEQQEVNSHLRRYIDNILMNIIDKYPELLEVRK